MRLGLTVFALVLLCNHPVAAQGGSSPVVSLTLTPRIVRLGLDAERRLTPAAQDSAKRKVPLGGRQVNWTSSDTAVVSVSQGLVKAVGLGAATVTAEVGGAKADARVTVIGWKTVTAGNDFACGITTDGRGFCWGEQAFGSLGRAGVAGSRVPAAVSGKLVFTAASSSLMSSSCALADQSLAFCWGFNNEGQIGDGTKDPVGGRSTPTQVAGDLRWIAVSGGYSYSCGVAADSVAHCWGASAFGLGNSTTSASLTPVPVENVARFASISVGYAHACGLASGGAAYCWGDNAEGDLGNGEMQKARQTPVQVANVSGFAAVDAGFGFTCGVTTAKELYCWGRNESGQLGNGTNENSAVPVQLKAGAAEGFTAVSAGHTHACAVATGGAAYCWGSNQNGELGNDSGTSSNLPVRVADPGRAVPRELPLTFASVSTGQALSCGVTTAGRAYCWGKNDDGQLGTGGSGDSRRPARIGPRP
jgi:alpha-tubulin suppressor-like RCC1 family protein